LVEARLVQGYLSRFDPRCIEREFQKLMTEITRKIELALELDSYPGHHRLKLNDHCDFI
jgi:hypothetical protein